MESFDFSDLTIKEVPVVFPDGKHYTLREANGKAATDHRNAIMASTIFGPDGKVVGIKSLASVEAAFIAACLWDDKERNPTAAYIQTWPARVQKQLYEKAKDLSDMNEGTSVTEDLQKVLALEGSPVSFEDLSVFICSQTAEEFKGLVKMFQQKADKDEQVKNS